MSWTDAEVRRVLHHLETMAAEVARLRKAVERVVAVFEPKQGPRDLTEMQPPPGHAFADVPAVYPAGQKLVHCATCNADRPWNQATGRCVVCGRQLLA